MLKYVKAMSILNMENNKMWLREIFSISGAPEPRVPRRWFELALRVLKNFKKMINAKGALTFIWYLRVKPQRRRRNQTTNYF